MNIRKTYQSSRILPAVSLRMRGEVLGTQVKGSEKIRKCEAVSSGIVFLTKCMNFTQLVLGKHSH